MTTTAYDAFAGDLERPLIPSTDAHEGGDTNAAAASSPAQPQAPAATVPQTCFIILSIYVGLGLLSQPFGLRLGGWAALLVLAVTAALFLISALLLTRACDLLPPGLPRTFPVLGDALFGAAGRTFVSLLAGLELFGAVTISLVVVLQQLELLLPSEGFFYFSPLTLACIITVSGLIPTLALPNVSGLASVAAAGSGASGAVALAVLCLLPLDPTRQHVHQPPAPRVFATTFSGIIQSVGIFAVSMSGHSTLPALRAAMKRPERFSQALLAAFCTMAAVYAVVASAGYWYWGEAVSPLVTYDLATNSPYAHASADGSGIGGESFSSFFFGWRHSWLEIDRILAALVLITCSAKVPALVMVVEELIKGLFPPSTSTSDDSPEMRIQSSPQQHVQPEDRMSAQARWQGARGHQFIARAAISGVALALGVAARNQLGNVLSLVGGMCSMMTSLVLPVAFYAKLSWGGQSLGGKLALKMLLVLGFLLLTQVTFQDAKHMWHQ